MRNLLDAGATATEVAEYPTTSAQPYAASRDTPSDGYKPSLPLPAGKTLALRTSVCYLPHPDKVRRRLDLFACLLSQGLQK